MVMIHSCYIHVVVSYPDPKLRSPVGELHHRYVPASGPVLDKDNDQLVLYDCGLVLGYFWLNFNTQVGQPTRLSYNITKSIVAILN